MLHAPRRARRYPPLTTPFDGGPESHSPGQHARIDCTNSAARGVSLSFRADAGSGKIGFNELYEFLRGTRHSLDRRSLAVPKSMPIAPPDGAVWRLEDVAWDVDVLRVLVVAALERHECTSAAQILHAWDLNADGFVNLEEFAYKMRTTFFPNEPLLWSREVCAAAAGPEGSRTHRAIPALQTARVSEPSALHLPLCALNSFATLW